MITTSQAWKTYSQTRSNYQPYIIVKKNDTVIWTFTPSNIREGSVRFTDEICDPGEFKLGATISNHFEADIINFDNTFPSPSVFYGCIAELYFCLPSAVLGSNAIAGIAIAGEAIVGSTGTVDRILRGTYRLEPVKSSGTIVHVEGYDYMNDEAYNVSIADGFSFTGKTPEQVIAQMGFSVASYPNTMFSTLTLPDLTVGESSGLQGISRRTVLGYLCEMCGCYARYSPSGQLLIKEFSASGTATEITKIMSEPDAEYYDLAVTGVHIYDDDTYDESVGSDGYYLTIENNPFIRTALAASQIATQLNTKYNGMTFTCYDVSWLADPSFEPGDYITFLNNGFRRYSIIASFSYDNGSVSTISFDADRDEYYSAEVRNAYSKTASDIQRAMSKATDAETLAQAAQQTADGKITTFYQTSAPSSGMHTGDLWIDTDDNNKLYRYSGSAWVNVQDGKIQDALLQAANAKSIADSKIVTFAQASQPTATDTGDLWVDTDDENKLYRWDGTAWVAMRDGTIATAQSKADSAYNLANNAVGYAQNRYGTCLTGASTGAKVASLTNFVLYTGATVTIYFTYGNTASTPTLNVNSTGAKDIWVKGSAIASQFYWKDGDTVTFIYDGTHWAMSETSANTLVVNWCYNNDTTYIDGANLYAGTVTAGKIAAGAIITEKLDSEAVTADKIDITDLFTQNITATNFHLRGGSVNIRTDTSEYDMIELTYYQYPDTYSALYAPSRLRFTHTYKDSYGTDGMTDFGHGGFTVQTKVNNSSGAEAWYVQHEWGIRYNHANRVECQGQNWGSRLKFYNQYSTVSITLDGTGGNITATGTIQGGSDRRLKDDIRLLDNAKSADFVHNMKPSSFKYNADPHGYHHGFIAQDIEELLIRVYGNDSWKVVGQPDSEGDGMRYKTLAYMELLADVVATIQTHNERIKALENA